MGEKSIAFNDVRRVDPSINSAATYAIDCLACHKYGAGVIVAATIALYVKHASREILENWKVKNRLKRSEKVISRASVEIRLNFKFGNIEEKIIGCIVILSRDNLL